jgi:CRISPR/Cas system CSM-associated protein Csm3 (group 7 of RAMP superfamily)
MRLRLTLEFRAPVHHGTGSGVAGIVDRAFLRDLSGMPYLSGAAIKGKFRFAAMRLLRAREGAERKCRPWEAEGTMVCRKPPYCLFCRTFGSPRVGGAAEFRDAFPEEGVRPLIQEQVKASASIVLSGPTTTRHSTAIDRTTRTVQREHLFSTEVTEAELRFETEIGGRLDAAQVQLLKDCAAVLSHFGSDSARGLGHCRYVLQEEAE